MWLLSRLGSVFLSAAVATLLGSFAALPSKSAEQAAPLPAWLAAHVGDAPGQIARPVIERARALYIEKSREGVIDNPCYFAMDATRPNEMGPGELGGRFYVVCEAQHTIYSISAGHGGGRNLAGVANFSNGRRCVKNFGNAADSELTAGGEYLTAETKTSFKGYYRAANGEAAPFLRSFIQFDGIGETANARERAIGGHAAVVLRNVCLRKDAASPYADQAGYVPFGKLVEYAGGRSNGCTSWSPSDARQILSIAQSHPTTLYIYPSAEDVAAVARASGAHQSLSKAGLYWNASCLSEIRSPTYWPRGRLEPLLARYFREHPAPPRQPTPLCPE